MAKRTQGTLLYDAAGKPMRVVRVPARAQGWDAAGSGRRASGWVTAGENINALVMQGGELLRQRARDMIRKSPWASSAVRGLVADLVGTGIALRSRSKSKTVKEAIELAWTDWTEVCDAAGLLDFALLQMLVCRTVIESGEALVRFRPRRARDGLDVPLQLEVLEPDHLPLHDIRDLPNGNIVRHGIEFNAIGRRVAYHLLRHHPGDVHGRRSTQTTRVLADQVLHVFRVDRPGQVRGVPWSAPVLAKIYELDLYDDAELVRKKVAALFAGFIKKTDLDEPTGTEDPDEVEDDGSVASDMEPGTLQVLGPGEEVQFSDPVDVGGSYGDFMGVQLHAVSAGFGTTYERMTGDLKGVTFSSIRGGELPFRRWAMQMQALLAHQLCRPGFRRWFQVALLSEVLQIGQLTSEVLRDARRVHWAAPGWPWVDPLKDAKAAGQSLADGTTSRSRVIEETGRDPVQVDEERAEDRAREQDLQLSSAPPPAAPAGDDAVPSEEQEAAEDTGEEEASADAA